MEIVYIRPKSPFPLDLPSNKIFGAICVGIRAIYGEEELNEMLSLFHGNDIPFIISSAFPFVDGFKDRNKHHFFPKLITEPDKTEDLDSAKKFKKVEYVDESIFNEWINGKISESTIIKVFDDRYKTKDKLLFPRGVELKFKLAVEDVPHNQLNRLSSCSENFYYSKGRYFDNAGLFFLIKFFDGKFKSKITSALKFIKDRGFGGDISSGEGQFEIEIISEMKSTEMIDEPDEADTFTTLSRYSPTDEFNSFDKDRIWYELVKIRGRCGDGITKKSLLMLKEGSTFPIIDREFYGKVREVRSDPRRTVEYGISFPIKVKTGIREE
jgi:CRISPR-associated protein Csm4